MWPAWSGDARGVEVLIHIPEAADAKGYKLIL
jgi:hypothetical protein